MIKVYPLRKLEAQHIFHGSNGNRYTLSPAESVDDVGKTAQEFDGTDFLVATKIMACVKDKTVRVEKSDMAILKATLDAGASLPAGEAPDGAKAPTNKEIEAAVKEAVDDLTAAHEEVLGEAADAAKKAHETAMGDAADSHSDDLKTAAEAAEKATSEAVDSAVTKALTEAAETAAKAQEKSLSDAADDFRSNHLAAIKTLDKAHERAIADIQKDLKKALKKVPK